MDDKQDTIENSKLEKCSCTYKGYVSSADEISDMLLMNLVNQGTSILESIYDEGGF